MDELAARIRTARKEAGLTREHLAGKIDVSLATVVRYETGRTQNISTVRLSRIAEATGKPIVWFFEATV
jgi:transcriptional regulator with XRE-family HTH domain